MKSIAILIYFLVFIIFALIGYAVLQIKLFGMNVKDFWSFIEANQTLDRLYEFSKNYAHIIISCQTTNEKMFSEKKSTSTYGLS